MERDDSESRVKMMFLGDAIEHDFCYLHDLCVCVGGGGGGRGERRMDGTCTKKYVCAWEGWRMTGISLKSLEGGSWLAGYIHLTDQCYTHW